MDVSDRECLGEFELDSGVDDAVEYEECIEDWRVRLDVQFSGLAQD